MIPYFIVFAVATFFAFIAERCFKKEKKKSGIIILFCTILFLAIFAGLRTTDLGYDTSMYFTNIYREATNRSFAQYKVYMNSYRMENGFLLYTYILTLIGKNINFVLFGLQFIVSFAYMLFAIHNKEKCSITLSMFIYCCSLYAYSFNILRQGISLAFCFLMIIFQEKKKYKLMILSIILGCMFHNSGIFMIAVPILTILNDTKKIGKKSKLILNICILVTIVLGLMFYETVISTLANMGIIGSRYAYYINSNSRDYKESIDIEWSMLILKTFILGLSIMYFNNKKIDPKEKEKNSKWFIMLIMDYLITFLSFKLSNTDRISWYMYYPALFSFFPQTINVFKNNKTNRIVGNIVISGIFFAYILEKFITNQYHIVPYTWIL